MRGEAWIAVLCTAISMTPQCAFPQGAAGVDSTRQGSETEFFPIISFDTDAGFGYGGKMFSVGSLGMNESFDLTLFNSTKGERWYRLVFSLPDLERRQGTVYPLAIDVAIDYDKWISANFFGTGGGSVFGDREFYTKEPLDVSVTCSRGFTPYEVGQVGLRVRTVRNSGFGPSSRLQMLAPRLNADRVTTISLFVSARHDSRNSFVNATEGFVLQCDAEWSPAIRWNTVAFGRIIGWAQGYHRLFWSVVGAARLGLTCLTGSNLPVQVLVPIGGGGTVRGSPQDRLLGRVGAVANFEFRFPIAWRFGGVAGGDAGQVWDSPRQIGSRGWQTCVVAGIRFLMDTFVVRLDVGAGAESTGFYLNFGQVF